MYHQNMTQLKKEDADYLKPRLNPSQIANIKKTWQNKNR